MKRIRDHHSPELFDPWEHLGPKRRRLLEIGWAGVFREYLLERLPINELADGFCDGRGRLSKDLSVALGALILQQLHDLTDQQTTEAVALNMAWHYALDKEAKQGKLTLEDFVLDDEGRVVNCPAGHRPLETHIAQERLQVLFVPVVCGACPHKDQCPAAAVGRPSQRYQYTHDRVRQRARRLHDASDEFRDRYRWRAGVEATMSRFKHQMGMAHLRIRGMQKVTFTALLRALGLNIHRVAAWKRAMATA